MVSYITSAAAYGLSVMRGVERDQPVAHEDLEHAHWDPVARRWYTHDEQAERAVARAA